MKWTRENGLFILLLFAFLVFRLCTLLTSVEYVYWDEELYRGTIAKELIEGLKIPFWNYRADPFHGGSLVVGILAVPLFLLLGVNLFALKVVALLFSLATLVLTFFFFKRFFDKKAALLACAFLILPPPVFTGLSLCTTGSHPESLLFTSAMLLFLYRYLYGQGKKRGSLIPFGLVSAFAFWFTPSTLPGLLTCLVSWWIFDRRSFLSRDILLFSASFCVGYLPLVYCDAMHGFFPVIDTTENFFRWDFHYDLAGQLVYALIRLTQLAFELLPSLFRFRPFLGIPDYPLTFLYGLTAWSLLVPFIWREGRKVLLILKDSLRHAGAAPLTLERAKFVPFLIFPFLFILMYSATRDFSLPTITTAVPRYDFVQFRHFSPLYYFLFLLLALALRSHRNPTPPLLLFLSLGLLGQGSLIFNEPIGKALRYQGYSYLCLADPVRRVYPFPERLSDFQSLANQFKEPERRLLYRGYAQSLALARIRADLKTVLRAIERVPKEYRPFFIESLGYQLGTLGTDTFEEDLALGKIFLKEDLPFFYYGLATGHLDLPSRTERRYLRLHSIQQSDVLYKHFFLFDLGRSMYSVFYPSRLRTALIEVPDSLGEEEKTWLYRGIGAEAGYSWIWSMNFARPFDPLVAKFSLEAQAEFFWGMGWGVGMAEVCENNRTRLLDWILRLEGKTQGWALKGFEEYEEWYGMAPRE